MTRFTRLSDGTRVLNLVGKTYGNLTATEYAGKDSRGSSLFEFACVCGRSKVIRGTLVTTKQQTSCGCLIGKANRGRRNDDNARSRIGERHGRLTIVAIDRQDRGSYQMVSLCDCGSAKRVACAYAELASGKVKSCGCHQKEVASINGSLVGLDNGRSGGRMGWEVNGLRVRSGLEVLVVLGLMSKGVVFQYEPEIFKLGNGLRYKPDFYIPATDRWIEVKGRMQPKDEIKIAMLRSSGKKLEVVMQQDAELLAGMSYRSLLKSGLYRTCASRG